MKRILLVGLWWGAGTGLFAADPDAFTKRIRPEDYAAAGLGKLSAEERTKLDALVSEFKTGAVTTARQEAAAETKVAVETAVAKEKEKDQEKKSEPGFFSKVLLKPGTKVEYESVESRIDGDFTGWEGHAVFKLENGQRWTLANPGESFYVPALKSPAVKISPAATGGFWMKVEGVSRRVRVLPFGV